MIEFQTHKCGVCGEQFNVACLSQLQEKLKTHKCIKKNKRVERTRQLRRDGIALYVRDTVTNNIEEHNFNKLVNQGMLVNA